MSPRPRTITDDEILAAAARAMGRLGPTRLTLADMAREAGVSPATLVQRFGSKRALLLAVSRSAAEGVEACFRAVRGASSSPLDALLSAATDMTRFTRTPEEMANHLAWLQIDVSDPEFHAYILESSRGMLEGYRALLDEAVEAGELVACDTRSLARAIAAVAAGSLLNWAIFRKGTAESWVRADLGALLDPYRTRGRAAKGPARKRARRRPRSPQRGGSPRA
jgi:AcrR family transcriptional regulator